MKKSEEQKTKKAFDNMAMAISEYLKAMGGSAVVVGGVSVEEGNLKNKFTLRVGIVGKKPIKKLL